MEDAAFSEQEMLRKVHTGDKYAMEYLLNKYNPLVKKEARTMYLLGGDTEDLIQEGMIGLFKAIQDYDSEKNVLFSSFAKLCIDRKLYTAVTASNRKKHDALNNAVSIEQETRSEDGSSLNLKERLAADAQFNPESHLIAEESMEDLERLLKGCLSRMEYEVIGYYRNGMSYTEIAARMGKSPKAIDNAIQRARGKISARLGR
ncbi:MAG: sigma-70 family RNA polymerase sigma factor [Lachnospiraceae bacterium]|nr:sigma-70 family RNA polymerase sigma factor [Lachnospiraceae bacterium]